MEINHRKEGDILCITIKGRLDADSSPEAEKSIKEALQDNTNRLLFDLGPLEYLSSAGLRILLSASKEIKRREGRVVLCALNEYVREIFEVSGFSTIIPIANSVEDGIKALS